jgi:hypothetical protein
MLIVKKSNVVIETSNIINDQIQKMKISDLSQISEQMNNQIENEKSHKEENLASSQIRVIENAPNFTNLISNVSGKPTG